MSADLRSIVDGAQQIIGEISGAGVQTYGEDAMMADAIRGFNLLLKKYDWDQYMEWINLTLNGTGKVVEDDLEAVKDFEDIRAIHRAGEASPVPVWPKSSNPNTVSSGTQIVAWRALSVRDAEYAQKKILTVPLTATGTLNVHAKIYPYADNEWNWDSVLDLDKNMIEYATAFMTLVGDALNPDHAELARSLMETRFNDITGALAGRTIGTSPSAGIPTQWFQSN